MADQEQEKTYEVKDKRRVNPDGTLKEPEEPVTPESEEQEPAEAQAPEPEEEEVVAAPNVYAFLELMATLLADQAWQLMGIRLAEGHQEVLTDMGQAKIAIDTIVYISDKLSPHVTEEDRRALRTLVSDLQLNFVTRSQ